MSLDFLHKPLGRSATAPSDASPERPPRRGRGGPNPEDVRRAGTLTIGGEPRVDLMPPEVRVKRLQLRTRRSLRLGLIAVAAVVVLGCGGSIAWSGLAGVNLTLAQAEATGLVQQQEQFSDVKSALDAIGLIQAGQRVGASTEIDWNSYLGQVAAKLPSGVRVAGFQVDQATPIQPYEEDLKPLQGDRIATLTVTTESVNIPPVAQMLASMESLTGFVDVVPGDVVWQDERSLYKATLTMRVDVDAFDGRFQKIASTTGGK